jgi:hypothetical protein
MPSKAKLSLECSLLFFVLPPSLYFVRRLPAFRIFFMLLVAATI